MDTARLASVALMLAAMTLIPLGDAAGKLLTEGHGIAPLFVAFVRFAVGAVVVAAILGERPDWRLARDGRVWLRAGLIAGGIACILTALRTAPFADVFAAFFVGPVVSYVLSVRLLGERVRPAQSVLLAVGFAGVLLVVRPGFGMAPGLGWALAAGACYGGFLTASRWLGGIARPRQLMLSQTAMGTVLLAVPGLWVAPEAAALIQPVNAALLLGSGLASAAGNLLLILAYRRAAATVLAPFVYFQLIAATTLGWLVFDTLPGPAGLAGLSILVAAGFGGLLLRPLPPAGAARP